MKERKKTKKLEKNFRCHNVYAKCLEAFVQLPWPQKKRKRKH
jgi:hypothetical protein